jgi:hypothetical protein
MSSFFCLGRVGHKYIYLRNGVLLRYSSVTSSQLIRKKHINFEKRRFFLILPLKSILPPLSMWHREANIDYFCL